MPYLYSLLGIAESDDPLEPLNPQTRRRRTLEAIKRILVRESLSQPPIVEFEDLHWIDSETQALLNLLVDGIATARILLLVNYRPEYQHQWGSKTYYANCGSTPRGKESAQEFLTTLVGDDESTLPLLPAVRGRLAGKAGTPSATDEPTPPTSRQLCGRTVATPPAKRKGRRAGATPTE